MPRSESLWSRLCDVLIRYLDVIPRLVDHFIGATREHDNVTPSSSRVNGTLIILTILVLQLMIIGVLCWKIFTLDPALATASVILPIYVRTLSIFLLWALLFDVATALSLYGINVWRFVAAIRTGSMGSDTEDTSGALVMDPPEHPKTSADQVVPPPGRIE